jgi:hypothetical protein
MKLINPNAKLKIDVHRKLLSKRRYSSHFETVKKGILINAISMGKKNEVMYDNVAAVRT